MDVDIRNPRDRSSATGAQLFRSDSGGVLFGGINRSPDIWGGRAVIDGTRIPVFAVVDQYEEFDNVDSVLEAYPELRPADVHLALLYADLEREGVRRDRETYLEQVPPEARTS